MQKRKYIIMVSSVLFLWIVLCCMDFYNVLKMYSLDGMNAPVHSLPFMKEVPLNISIWQYCLLVYIVRFLWMLLISCIFSEISIWLKNQELSLLLCGLLLLPSVFDQIGVDTFARVSITKVVHVSHFFRQGILGVGKEVVICFVFVLIMLISIKIRGLKYVKN